MPPRKIWELSPGPSTALGHALVTVGVTATSLPSIPATARRAIIRPLGQPINYRDDGTDPTGTTGFPVLKDEVYVYDGDPLSSLRMILSSTATGDAEVRVAYYG